MPERFTAVAPLITLMMDGQLAACHQDHLLPILALAGVVDRSQPYEGWIYPQLGFRLASVPETLEFWRRLQGCIGQDVSGVPNHENTGPTRVTLVTWTGCTTGGSVQLLRVQGGGHQSPTLAPDANPPRPGNARNHHVETAEEVWRFLSKGRLTLGAAP